MKKIAGKIAMVMVLVILANSFISCFSTMAVKDDKFSWLFWTIPLDIITLPVQLIIFVTGISFTAYGGKESQIYLASAEYNSFAECSYLREKISSLPEAELFSLKQTLNSIPETECDSTIEKLTSLSETNRISLISGYNSLQEKEIISSINRINSLSNKELVSLLRTFNSLSEDELNFLIESLLDITSKE
ncbi:hypothetical protein [Treponema sp. R6D11]